MAIQALRTVNACALCVAVAARGALEDELSLLQMTQDVEQAPPEDSRVVQAAARYTTFADSKRAGNEAQHTATYEALRSKLEATPALSHSRHILSYLQAKDYSPSLLNGGCLYLPTNKAWTEFYHQVEHPYPPLFAEMIANSFYPNCTSTALAGAQRKQCPGGRVQGAIDCVEARAVGTAKRDASEFDIFETEGHVGLAFKWKNHIEHVRKNNPHWRQVGRSDNIPKDTCSKSWALPAVPENKKLVIPTQFIVCTSTPFHKGISTEMIKEQARWMTNAYRGRSTYTKMPFDHEDIPEVDMQIEFETLNKNCTPTAKDDCHRIKYVKDKECAEHAYYNDEAVSRHNLDPFGLFTVVVVSNDQSGILGMARFPQIDLEGHKAIVVRISVMGLRGYSSTNTDLNLDTSYDEGDTVVHEAGHSMGLFHTFEGGCTLDGDQIADTHPEAQPQFTCVQEKTCGTTNPVHNFMDYTPDACMNGFTETQKRRLWCVFKHYRPKLFLASLQSDSDFVEKTESDKVESVATSSGENVTVPVTVPVEGTGSAGKVIINIHTDKSKP